jgi:hypothetical protein
MATADEIRRLNELHAKLQATVTEIKELNAEGHGLLKDLRAEVKKAQQLVPMIVSRRISAEVSKQLQALGEETEEAMQRAVDKVGREFDKVQAMFMGEDEPGKDSLLDMLDKLSPLLPIMRAIMDGTVHVGELNVSHRGGEVNADLSYSRSYEAPDKSAS